MELDTAIQDIPCTVGLKYSKAWAGAREKGSGLQFEPDEPASYKIIAIYKRGGKGKDLVFFWDKMTDEDRERITQTEAWEA